eukprot:TRINITY_DN6140_c0_g1_i1.p2 TRINITY_DN6140_c0_g1~~TRINITY_DN6140_c0_g1_i1.p2  ORF type:complete len:100 (-),score=64.00 TRINITY_DN6140_c0_g1_i1:382-681(-)
MEKKGKKEKKEDSKELKRKELEVLEKRLKLEEKDYFEVLWNHKVKGPCKLHHHSPTEKILCSKWHDKSDKRRDPRRYNSNGIPISEPPWAYPPSNVIPN